jgi:hypothetical protein
VVSGEAIAGIVGLILVLIGFAIKEFTIWRK